MSGGEFGVFMIDTPKVSIVVPVYNGSNYLAEAIESALSQTYQNIEVIVVNDGSSDNKATRNVALQFKDRIRYFEKENGGVSSALNLGISKMQGEYFCWLSHDDLYDKEKTAVQLAYMQENNLSVTYCDYRFIDQNGNNLKEIESPCYDRLEAMKMLIGSGYIHGCTVLIKHELFKKIGLFNEELKYTQDIDMWFRMLTIMEFDKIPKVLISSRVHQTQTSILNNSEHYKEIYKFYESALENQMLQNYLFSTEISINDQHANEALRKSELYNWMGDKLMYKNNNYFGAYLFYLKSINSSPIISIIKTYKLYRSILLSIIIEKGLGNVKKYLRTYPLVVMFFSKIRNK